MVNINSSIVKELRERTGAGIVTCKNALVKSKGNIELAIDDMRKSGQVTASKKFGRITINGIISSLINQNKTYGIILEINCETDFVAKDSLFKDFSKTVTTTALKKGISDLSELRNQFEEQRLELVAKTGENIKINRIGSLKGKTLGSYMHGTSIGVIVSASNAKEELIKQVAMHIAASNPEYINANEVPDDIIARESKIQLEIAIKSGKKDEIAEKMIKGRMRKFTDQISLINQSFIIDPSKTVGQFLIENNAMINNFIRFKLGEGIK